MNEQLLNALQQLQQNAAADSNQVSGPIRVFKSGALLGDLRVQRLPEGITFNVAKAKDGSEYLTSKTEWSGVAHVGPHGRAWVDNLKDTGVAFADGPTSTAVDFAALMASAKGSPTPATPAL